MDTTRNAETPPNFVPKTLQKWPWKLPNVASETLEKKSFGCLCDNRPVASRRFETFNLATLQLATAWVMDTTRNAETPPNFVPKTLQKWPGKLPNVASETLEKKDLLAAFEITVLSRPVALTSAATAWVMDTTRNAETPPNFVPKTLQKWPGKLPNVASNPRKNLLAAFEITVLSRPVALKPSTLQLGKVQQLDWWTPLGCLWDNRPVASAEGWKHRFLLLWR